MARLDTIRALERRGLSPNLAEKVVDLGYLLGTLKKCDLKTLKKDFHYKEILQLIDVSKNTSIDREDIVLKAIDEGDVSDGPITADQALRRVEKKLGVIWSLPEGYTIDGVASHISKKGQVLLGVAFPINSKQFRYPFNGYVYLKTRGICYQSVVSEVVSFDRPDIPEEDKLLLPAHTEEPYVTFLRIVQLIELPRTIRLEEFRKMDGTQVKSARNYTQVEDALDLDRERLRFEEERLTAVKLYKEMGLSEKVSRSLYKYGIFKASQVVIATDNELRNAGVPASKIAKLRDAAAEAAADQNIINKFANETRTFYGEGGIAPTPGFDDTNLDLMSDKRISLYLPKAIQIQDTVTYDNAFQLGLIGGAVEKALGTKETAAAAMAGAMASEVLGFGKTLLGSGGGMSKEGAGLLSGKVAAMIPKVGTGVGGAIRSATGLTTNPNTRAIFKDVPIRNFSFAFQLIPTSRAEAEAVEKIIKRFRTELYPTSLQAGGVNIGYKFPNRFQIKVKYNNREINGIKFLPVYLQSFNATYNAASGGMHSDGRFSAIDISMNFSETRALTKIDIEKKGY